MTESNGTDVICAQKLSEREVEVLRLVAQGSVARYVAERLIINPKTVEDHLENI